MFRGAAREGRTGLRDLLHCGGQQKPRLWDRGQNRRNSTGARISVDYFSFEAPQKKRRMARKNTVGRKSSEDAVAPEADESVVAQEISEAATPAAEEVPVTKAKSKATEETSSAGAVGIGDIRKAVAFANSVGGLDKAIALLQIVKVAKEVQ